MAQTRNGKQVLNLGEGATARACAAVEGDTVAVIGENRKLLLFPLVEVPEMGRGRGVLLQRYHDGGLADVRTINLADGLTWKSGERTRTELDLSAWKAARASSGRIAPRGFPANNKFA